MAGFQTSSAANAQTFGSTPTNTTHGGIGMTPNATANTKGAYAQLTAGASFDANMLYLKIAGQPASAYTKIMIDLAIGPSGSEQIIFPNIILPSNGNSFFSNLGLLIPIFVPANTRIAVRDQVNIASAAASYGCSIDLFGGAYDAESYARVDDIGTVTATSTGTPVTCGNTTKGSYAQLIAATARDYAGFYFMSDAAAGKVLLDLAIGPSGSEKIIIPDINCGNGQPNGTCAFASFVPTFVPAGTRLACRGASYTGSGGTPGVIVYGVYK